MIQNHRGVRRWQVDPLRIANFWPEIGLQQAQACYRRRLIITTIKRFVETAVSVRSVDSRYILTHTA